MTDQEAKEVSTRPRCCHCGKKDVDLNQIVGFEPRRARAVVVIVCNKCRETRYKHIIR